MMSPSDCSGPGLAPGMEVDMQRADESPSSPASASEATRHVSSEEYQAKSRYPQEGSEEIGGEKGKSFEALASTPRPRTR